MIWLCTSQGSFAAEEQVRIAVTVKINPIAEEFRALLRDEAKIGMIARSTIHGDQTATPDYVLRRHTKTEHKTIRSRTYIIEPRF